jgi:hypothetical protein
MDLPSTQTTFDFEFVSELGKKYEGRFTVHCLLNMRLRHLLELEKTRLLGNYLNPTDSLGDLAILLANLRNRIIDGPPWWTQSDGGYNISDFDALVELHSKVLNAEVEWRNKLKEKTKKLSETTPENQQSSNV